MPNSIHLPSIVIPPSRFRRSAPYGARVVHGLLRLVLGLLGLAVALALLLLENNPLIDPARQLSAQEMSAARSVLDFGIRSVRSVGVTNAVSLNSEELDATVNYLLKQYVTGIAHFRLEDGRLIFTATARLGNWPWLSYLNLSIRADTASGRFNVAGVRVGDANLPANWALAGLALAQRYSTLVRFLDVTDKAVKDIAVEPDRLRVIYSWDSASLNTLRDLMLDITGKRRLRHYHARLVETVKSAKGRRMALGDLLQPLFALAQERSKERDPIEENRALLLVLSTYLSGHKTAPVLAAHYSASVAQPRTVLLNNRLDLAKHFIISAALAATSSGTFADFAGLTKEIDDSHGGSGFNFQDLAADMAGQRFGQLAVAGEKSARRLQKRLSRNAEDSVIMPQVRDLPENLDAETFASRYVAVGSPAFAEVERDIAQRLDAMGLYWRGTGD
ncbi:MAG: hypothetical protein EPN21_19495 [Methylococcaceae bacterium]|nr:MAG: hypothetical protein EPN21_19495 [Methylococcaceae bacterium]